MRHILESLQSPRQSFRNSLTLARWECSQRIPSAGRTGRWLLGFMAAVHRSGDRHCRRSFDSVPTNSSPPGSHLGTCGTECPSPLCSLVPAFGPLHILCVGIESPISIPCFWGACSLSSVTLSNRQHPLPLKLLSFIVYPSVFNDKCVSLPPNPS